MVLAKSSRKGKKAWRRNVDASAEEEALAAVPLPGGRRKAAAGAGGRGAAALPDAALFFEDKVRKRERTMPPLGHLVGMSEARDTAWGRRWPHPVPGRTATRRHIISTHTFRSSPLPTTRPPPAPPRRAPAASPRPACAGPPP